MCSNKSINHEGQSHKSKPLNGQQKDQKIMELISTKSPIDIKD